MVCVLESMVQLKYMRLVTVCILRVDELTCVLYHRVDLKLFYNNN